MRRCVNFGQATVPASAVPKFVVPKPSTNQTRYGSVSAGSNEQKSVAAPQAASVSVKNPSSPVTGKDHVNG